MDITNNLLKLLWWRWVPKVSTELPWPTGWVVLHEHADGSKVSTESADPNDHYRPWLEATVGRQYIDWNWEHILGAVQGNQRGTWQTRDGIRLFVRRDKAECVTMAALKWNK